MLRATLKTIFAATLLITAYPVIAAETRFHNVSIEFATVRDGKIVGNRVSAIASDGVRVPIKMQNLNLMLRVVRSDAVRILTISGEYIKDKKIVIAETTFAMQDEEELAIAIAKDGKPIPCGKKPVDCGNDENIVRIGLHVDKDDVIGVHQ